MPNIRQYEAKDVALNPDERGMAALGRTASAIGQQAAAQGTIANSQESLARSAIGTGQAKGAAYETFGKQLGGAISEVGGMYVRYQTNKEISQGSAALATLTSDLTSNWNNASKENPNDSSLGGSFLVESVDPVLEKFTGAFSTEEGQQWAQQQALRIRQHMGEKVAADSATRAGQAMVENLDVLKNRATNMVLQDPTSLNVTLGLIDGSIDGIVGSNPNLDAEVANKARTELRQNLKGEVVEAAAVGMLQANPEAGIAALKDGRFSDYIDADKTQQLTRYGETLQNAAKSQARLDEAESRRQATEAAKADEAKLITSVIQPDGSLVLGPNYYKNVLQYVAAHGMNATNADSLIRFGEHIAEEAAKPRPSYTDPPVYSDFSTRLNLPDSDPRALTMNQVLDARTAGKLSDSDFQHFADKVAKPDADKPAEKQWTQFVGSLKSSITSSSLMKADAFGDQRYYEFHANADRLRAEYKKQGKTADEIERAVRATIPTFAVSQKQSMDYMRQQAAGGLQPLAPVVQKPGGMIVPKEDAALFGGPSSANVAPRQAGESAAAYLARTGGK